jgi:hypothetical protein
MELIVSEPVVKDTNHGKVKWRDPHICTEYTYKLIKQQKNHSPRLGSRSKDDGVEQRGSEGGVGGRKRRAKKCGRGAGRRTRRGHVGVRYSGRDVTS